MSREEPMPDVGRALHVHARAWQMSMQAASLPAVPGQAEPGRLARRDHQREHSLPEPAGPDGILIRGSGGPTQRALRSPLQ
jgi:hypothetical protein